MIGQIRGLKKNNKGSSFVITVIAVSFVAILGTMIMSATMANLRTKYMNYNSKKTFYNAESALEEVYTGVSRECFSKLDESYLETVTSLINFTGTGDHNDMANDFMKARYMTLVNNMLKANNAGVDPFVAGSSKDGLIAWMETYITHNKALTLSDPSITKYAYIESIGEILEDAVSCTFTLKDVTVDFVSTKDDYFSSVTVDMNIVFPNVKFNFIDNRNHLNTYLDFSIIGMQGVDIGTNVSAQQSGIYGGNIGSLSNGGIYLRTNSRLSLDDTLLMTCTDVNVSDGAEINVNDDSNLWATNINLDNGSSLGSTSGASMHVADDLNLNGVSTGSAATLSGEYYGFGYQAAPMARPADKYAYENYSSGIVVNGNDGELDMSGITTMLMAGRAYIKVGNGPNAGYMTGDSNGLKQIQEIYLVPTAYMNTGFTNPTVISPHVNHIPKKAVNLGALKNNPLYSDLINKTEPVTEIIENVGGGVTEAFYYINFENNEKRAAFVDRLISDSSPYKDEDGWEELHRIVLGAFENLSGSTLPSGASVVTGGNLFDVDAATKALSADRSHVTGVSSLENNCLDKAHRYKVLDQFLYDIGDDSDPTGQSTTNVDSGEWVNIPQLLADGGYGVTDTYQIDDTRSYYEYVIDVDKWNNNLGEILSKVTVNSSNIYINDHVASPGRVGTAVLIPDTDASGGAMAPVKLSELGVTSGVVLANATDVIIDNDFTGLVISNRTVYVKDNANVILKADREITENTIKYDPVLSQFFFAYQGANLAGLSAADVSNEDLLICDNWRKNYGK